MKWLIIIILLLSCSMGWAGEGDRYLQKAKDTWGNPSSQSFAQIAIAEYLKDIKEILANQDKPEISGKEAWKRINNQLKMLTEKGVK